MKRLALLLVLLLYAAPASASLAVLGNRAQGGATTSDTKIIAPNSGSVNHAAGDGLIALVNVISIGGTVTSVQNTAVDTWVSLGNYTDSTNLFNRYEIWYVNNSNGNAADVVQANLSAGTTFRTLVVYEISGQLASGMAGNLGAGTTSATGTAIASGSVTVVATEELIFMTGAGLGPPVGNGSPSYNVTNYNLDGLNNYYFDGYHIVTTSEAAVATQTSSNAWAVFAGSFRVATAAATTSTFRALIGVGK